MLYLEESNLLLSKQFEEHQKDPKKPAKASPEKSRHANEGGNGCAWTTDGLSLGYGSMMGEPMGPAQWDSSLLAISSVAAILKFLNLNLVVVACKLDPGSQLFDVNLQQRTSRVIHSLSAGLEVWSPSLDSLKDTRKWCQCDSRMQEGYMETVNKCSLLWRNTLRSLQMLNFCTSLKQCLERALNNQLIIQAAIGQFEEKVGAGQMRTDVREP
ncbi:hypothetical protein D8674_042034 [Pyrus ussuriensis x Pyrus communis]|uniref:Uncharacterized protein n=1 Tax=Pyrus ussuriensis x Pyrus communis TaxID=2448454 RepID=A0A5N5G1Z5_9ROSA|nr:hypothetical protein D8674_042034 [Pyrus ussuriensis x Pyrus communis]